MPAPRRSCSALRLFENDRAMIVQGSDPQAIAQAVAVLSGGGLVGMPTETVYGLAADADNPKAVAAVYATKGRPADHPLIVHLADAAGVDHFASQVPAFARCLMAAFWPGPLTLILPRRPGVAEAAAGGQHSIGLRCPAHPVAQALLQACLRQPVPLWGIAAPSANLFGRVSPTTADHVRSELGDALLVLDGGPCAVGIESTIIDCTRGQPVLLRPGAITPAMAEAVCGEPVLLPHELPAQTAPAPRASGTLASHYAPRARVRLMPAGEMRAALAALCGAKCPHGLVAVYARTEYQLPQLQGFFHAMPSTAETAAQNLFADLRAFDAHGVAEIWVETPPLALEWDGVRDRLLRASR
jgi:L-threonylcarbamoyladenylate synthase